MAFFNWFCRCIPGFTIIIWIVITYQALGGRIPYSAEHDASYDWKTLNGWQIIYIIYSLIAHICACVIFPGRLCYAVYHIVGELKAAKFEAMETVSSYQDSESDLDDKSSQTSLSGKTLSVSDSTVSRIGTPKSSKFPEDEDQVIHAIILPSYKETFETMDETLSVLATHTMAKSSYDVYLAMEQRDPEGESVATTLIMSFASSFRNISFTLHPGDIAAEVAGKSSNVSWAARQLSHNYADTESRKNCIVTVMDSDTHLSDTYFLLVTKYHRENQPEAASTMYTVPIIFDRNSNQVNALVRAADIFWCGAGLSGLYEGTSCAPPTSVYSLAMTLAGQVGGWDTGPESIGEDLHMFLKCYFGTSGQFHTKVIFAPASQCNVSGQLKGFRGEIESIQARYKQAMRHMWGSLDSGWAVQKFLEAMWNKSDQRVSSWLSRASTPADRVPLWVNESSLNHFTPPNLSSEHSSTASFNKYSLLVTFHRLYEAHFLPSHVTVALFSGVIYAAFVPGAVTNPYLAWSLGFNGALRFIGFTLVNLYLYFYESYHLLAVSNREAEMRRVGLYERMEDQFAYRSFRKNWIDYTCMPINGTVFGTIPAVVAEICHLWTDRLVYTVSLKPQLIRKVLADRVDKVIALA